LGRSFCGGKEKHPDLDLEALKIDYSDELLKYLPLNVGKSSLKKQKTIDEPPAKFLTPTDLEEREEIPDKYQIPPEEFDAEGNYIGPVDRDEWGADNVDPSVDYFAADNPDLKKKD